MVCWVDWLIILLQMSVRKSYSMFMMTMMLFNCIFACSLCGKCIDVWDRLNSLLLVHQSIINIEKGNILLSKASQALFLITSTHFLSSVVSSVLSIPFFLSISLFPSAFALSPKIQPSFNSQLPHHPSFRFCLSCLFYRRLQPLCRGLFVLLYLTK